MKYYYNPEALSQRSTLIAEKGEILKLEQSKKFPEILIVFHKSGVQSNVLK